MAKVGWRSKAIYLLFALALVVGLFGGVTSVYAQTVTITTVPSPAEGQVGEASATIEFTADIQNASGLTPYTYTFTWNYDYKQNDEDTYHAGDAEENELLFDGELLDFTDADMDESYTKSYEFTIPGFYRVQVEVVDAVGDSQGSAFVEDVRILGIIPSPIGFDAKGACHHICVKGVDPGADIKWTVSSGVDLSIDDIVDCNNNPIADVLEALGSSVKCIDIKSYRMGDIRINAEIIGDSLGDDGNITLYTEKKWGDVHHTVLDLDGDTEALEGPDIVGATFDALDTSIHEEPLEDTVYGIYKRITGYRTTGHAIVHWFLLEDTVENWDRVTSLMQHLVDNPFADDPEPGWDDPYGVGAEQEWAAHGVYNSEELPDLIGSSVLDLQPYDILEYWADAYHADTTVFSYDSFMDLKPWYYQNETEDSWPGEERGVARAELEVDPGNINQGTEASVQIVVLTTYPGSGDPKIDPHNGENIVSIERAIKRFPKGIMPEITMAKTPQVRWAGEKIILEQDWTDAIADDKSYDYWVLYTLDEESCGVLVNGTDNSGQYIDSRAVLVQVDPGNPTSEVILETEFQCKADVEAALYKTEGGRNPLAGELMVNIGFPVFFLAFEDIALEEDISGKMAELQPQTDLEEGEDAHIAVQVKGWFTNQQLGPAIDPATNEPRAWKPVDSDKDGVFDRILPEGRWVLPDDWQRLAGGSLAYDLRPNWDMMDQAHDDAIVSDYELGPFSPVITTSPDPLVAEAPCIGPFNTLQQWTEEDMWYAAATVPADYMVAAPTDAWTLADVRNTVVPDGAINEFDCPMPQALVIFDIDASQSVEGATLSGLDKGDLYGYGYMGEPGDKTYQSPFYQVEIPSSPFIPTAGYNWDSWRTTGPYDYWTDLSLNSILSNTQESISDPDLTDVEVYCDNNGIAGVQIDRLDSRPGVVTITATAEFPQALKKAQYPATTSDDIKVSWGVVEINPDLTGTPRVCPAVEGCEVEFTNWSIGGVLPYKSVTWNFGDGSPLETYTTAPEKDWGGKVTHEYTTAGQFIVCIKIVDAAGFEAEQCEGKAGDGYIKVGVIGPSDLVDYYRSLDGDPATVTIDELMAAADDWIDEFIPDGFDTWIDIDGLMILADEWIASS